MNLKEAKGTMAKMQSWAEMDKSNTPFEEIKNGSRGRLAGRPSSIPCLQPFCLPDKNNAGDHRAFRICFAGKKSR